MVMVTTQTFLALQVLFQTRAAVKLLADRQEKKTIFFLRLKKLLKQLGSRPKSWGYQCSPVGSAHNSSFLTRRDSSEMFSEPLSTNFFFFLPSSCKYCLERKHMSRSSQILFNQISGGRCGQLCVHQQDSGLS